MTKPATFVYDGSEFYYPANKNAVAACVIFSRRRLPADMINLIRKNGYVPMLTNGQELGKLDIII